MDSLHDEKRTGRSGLPARQLLAETSERTPATGPALLKRKGLAVALDCSLRTIDNLQANGLPCLRIGKSRRFILTEVVAWLRRKGATL